MTKNKIYLPDTNLLYNLAESIVYPSHSLRGWHKNAKSFWNRYGRQIEIPSLVWTEFSGVWFQKNINLEDYDKWFQDRLSIFNQTYLILKKNKTGLCDESDLSYKDIMSCASIITSQKMPAGLIQQIISRLQNTIKSCQKSIDNNSLSSAKVKEAQAALNRNKQLFIKGKILDGLDSVIVVFAYEFAKKHRDKKIIVVSGDKFMVDTMQYLHKHNSIKLGNYEIPGNVSARLPYKISSYS